jgi:hypothetical protein
VFRGNRAIRIDSLEGQALCDRRFATVEPVFANLRANKRLDRFTLRGRAKAEGQWQRYCLVHNIEKLAHAGYAAYGRRSGGTRVAWRITIRKHCDRSSAASSG